MKKKYVYFLIFVFFVQSIFAQQNNQKIWAIDSDVYRYLTYLYVNEGHSLPSSVGPWSTDELKRMLARFEDNLEKPESIKLYDLIYEILYKEAKLNFSDGLAANFSGSFFPELYVHSNSQSFNQEDDWYYAYNQRKDLLSLDAEAWMVKNFYFMLNCSLGYDTGFNGDEVNPVYSPVFMSNIPFVGLTDMMFIEPNFPKRALSSVGGEHWNIIAGRDINRWGVGETGNLFLGGNQAYDNTIRFSTFFDVFKYTFVTNFYAHEESFDVTDQFGSFDGLKVFMAHRLDFRFFRDKINFGFSEGLMYESASNTFDIRLYNHMMVMHNYFLRGVSNAIISAELDYTIFNGFNLYTQFVMDEVSGPGEPKTTTEADENPGGRPSRMGGMLGAKYIKAFNSGVLKVTLEGIYTDPYLYLREVYNPETKTEGVGLYGYNRAFSNHGEVLYLRKCIGYAYGGDCIVGDIKASFETPNKWFNQLELFYMAHGIMYNNLNVDWAYGKKPVAPSTHDITFNPTNEDGSIEHIFRTSVATEYRFFDWLAISAGMDNWFIWNKNNQPAAMVYDMQLHTGVQLSF